MNRMMQLWLLVTLCLGIGEGFVHTPMCFGSSLVPRFQFVGRSLSGKTRTYANTRTKSIFALSMGMSEDRSQQGDESTLRGQGSKQFWTSAVSVGESSMEAGVKESLDLVKKQLNGTKPHVAFVFISSRYLEPQRGSVPVTQQQLNAVVPTIQKELGVQHVLGCTATGVLGVTEEDGTPEEFESFKSVALSAAYLPGVDIRTFRLNVKQMPQGLGASQQSWIDAIKGPSMEAKPSIILLSGQAFASTGKLNQLMDGLDFSYPSCVKVGGISSGPISGGVACSEDGGIMHDDQAIGMCLSGDIEVESVVAQGCRAVGPLYEVTKSRGNVVNEVVQPDLLPADKHRKTPLAALQDVLLALDEKDLNVAHSAPLLVGIARDTFSDELGEGDYLVRQLMDVRDLDGALVLGDLIKQGQRFRFFLRDRKSAIQDAEALFSGYKRKKLMEMMSGKTTAEASGCLMFACSGRGRNLFQEANFDSRLAYLSTGVPVTGFFCNGEIGPVWGNTYVHCLASVFAVFKQKSKQTSAAAASLAGDK